MALPARFRISNNSTTTSNSSPGGSNRAKYRIPQNHHLLITTAGAIYAWDQYDCYKIFTSSRRGIRAAKASKDGSQVLAVADSQTVVLHDCRRNREESWGLNSPDDTTRLLEYAPDAKSLFLSTTLTGAVQCYSVHEARMSKSSQEHPSPPTVLAVNSTAQLMISASEDPPVTYVQNVLLEHQAHRLEPSASSTPVAVAAFHPDRSDVFLLGFKDGTLAAYNATKMARKNGVKLDINSSLDMEGTAAEIASFKRLHRTTNKGMIDQDASFRADCFSESPPAIHDRSIGVTAAAFVPGFLTRAVSVGGDGRCMIVDFAYNVLGLEWAQGSTPAAIRNSDMMPRRLKYTSVSLTESEEGIDSVSSYQDPVPLEVDRTQSRQRRSKSGSVAGLTLPDTQQYRDEIGENFGGTILRSPPRTNQPERIQLGLDPSNFSDLFSPARPDRRDAIQKLQARSPLRSPSRPRITSTTFERHHEGGEFTSHNSSESSTSTLHSDLMELDPNLTLSYLTTSNPGRQARPEPSPRRKTFMVTPGYTVTSSSEKSLPSKPITLVTGHVELSEPVPEEQHPMAHAASILPSRKHAHPSPARPKRRSQQRPSFTAYMNRTGAADLRRRSRTAAPPARAGMRGSTIVEMSPNTQIDSEEQWHTSGSETEKVTSTLPTAMTVTRAVDVSASDHLANVPRKDSIKKPAPSLLNAQTIYHDAPTYPPTRNRGRLLESLRRDRPKTAIKAFPYTSFMPSDPSKMPQPPERPLQSKAARVSTRSPEILITPPAPDRKSSLRATQSRPARSKAAKTSLAPASPSLQSPFTPEQQRPKREHHAYYQKKLRSDTETPHPPGTFPLSTTSEEAFTAPENTYPGVLDGKGGFVPASEAIRGLCPRGSSLSPRKDLLVSKFSPAKGRQVNGRTARAQEAGDVKTRKDRKGANWKALEEGMELSRPRGGIFNPDHVGGAREVDERDGRKGETTRRVGNGNIDNGPERKSRFTEGQVDGLADVIVDAIKRASDINGQSDLGSNEDKKGDRLARKCQQPPEQSSPVVEMTSMRSGLTPSPLKIIRHYAGEDDDERWRSAKGTEDGERRQSSITRKQAHVKTMVGGRETSLASQVRKTINRSDGHDSAVPHQNECDGQVGDHSCSCCETLTREITTLREEIVGLRADLAGGTLVPEGVREMQSSQGHGPRRSSNDLYSFSETR
ncbi:hypothetical protein CAC42_488 [Sphaceloma murrayae]|uniref:Uncharacterized protein n=1 Tax=Sphaceloma murrayae TaxID=2082308 RepID=A0A2K1R3M8_9PEZI|nr:hypothetical protein CAC42_488 [Sphaceloma murrayae]